MAESYIGTSDGKTYASEWDYLLGNALEEPRTEAKNAPATPVPAVENNASTGFLGAPQGTLEDTLAANNVTQSTGVVEQPVPGFGQRHDWVEKSLAEIGRGLGLFGTAAEGKTPITTQEAIEGMTAVAGALILGPAPIARKIVDGTLGSFGGVKAKGLTKEVIEKAKKLHEEGASADQVWKETGLFFNPLDQKLRFEISDAGASLKKIPEVKPPEDIQFLFEILDHPELYKNYPQLKNIEIQVDPTLEANAAAWNSRTKSIEVSGKSSETELKSNILHEVQHAIQDIEGFAKGANFDWARAYKLRYEKELADMEDRVMKMYKRIYAERRQPTAEENAFFERVNRLVDLDAYRQKAAPDAAYNKYLRSAGEAEARNVETRLDPNKAKLPPWKTYDVPEEELIPTKTAAYATPYGLTTSDASIIDPSSVGKVKNE